MRPLPVLPVLLLSAAIVVVGAGLVPGGVKAQTRDSSLDWLTVKSKHFAVHYHAPLGVLARRVVQVAENAHEKVATALGHRPSQITHVVLTDNVDSANGSASVLPYNVIRLYATAPDDLSPLADHDDWLSTLMVHEHTHIVHLDTIGGIPALVNAVFGRTMAPNQQQPRWFIEGVAVVEESAHTTGGRGRSSVFEMQIRMDALQDRLLSIDQLSHPVDRWPHGTTYYLYGEAFVQYIMDRHGVDALAAISHDYGSNLIPYALNRVAKRATGKSFYALYDDFRAHEKQRALALKATVAQRPWLEGKKLTQHGETCRAPRFVDDDTLLYFAADGRNYGQIRRLSVSGAAPTMLVRANSPGSMSVVRGEGRAVGQERVVFAGADAYKDVYFLTDLHVYDPVSGDTTRLTHGRRAREPDVSPDGKRIAFSLNTAGTSHLAITSFSHPKHHQTVVRSKRFEQVYTPRWSPDGRYIAYSGWKRGGYRDLFVYDVREGTTTQLTDDRFMDTGPTWSADGKHLYFSSDRNGIFNIYRMEVPEVHPVQGGVRAGETMQVTNLISGAFQPSVSPNGKRLAYLGYSSWGWDVFVLELDPSTFLIPQPTGNYRDAHNEGEQLTIPPLFSEDYNPFPTLMPRAYEIELGQDGFGDELAVSTRGFDAVGLNSYTARIGVGLEEGNINAALAWSYNGLAAPINTTAFHRESPRGGLFVEGQNKPWIERAYGVDTGMTLTMPQAFSAHALSTGYAISNVDKARPFGGELDPNDPPPRIPTTGILTRLRFGWAYSNTIRTIYDISPSFGRRLSLSTSMSHPYIGSRFQALSFRWSGTQFIENPWIEHHVLALRYAGGWSDGRRGTRSVFAVGGFPDSPVLDALNDGIILGGVALRGYEPSSRIGTKYHLAQLEYRFPIWRPQWGPGTLPLFFKRIYGAVFTDYGDAFYGSFNLDEFRLGVGGEVLVDFQFRYFEGYTLRAGLARGLSETGITQFYLNLGRPF